jgi:hypothetical protein
VKGDWKRPRRTSRTSSSSGETTSAGLPPPMHGIDRPHAWESPA